MAKHIGLAGDAKSTRLVEQRMQQMILNHAVGDAQESGLLTELAEYLRIIFGADVCLLYSQSLEQGIVTIESHCTQYPRSMLMPLVEKLLRQPQCQDQKIAEVAEINSLGSLDLCQLPSSLPSSSSFPTSLQASLQESFQNMVSLLSLKTKEDGLILLGRNQGHRSGQKPWAKGQKDLLTAIGDLGAIALALSRKAETQPTPQQGEISYPYQKLINQITQAIRDHQEINQILKQAITATGKTLKANAGLVFLLKYKDLTWKKSEANSLGMIQVTTVAEWATPEYKQQLFPSQPAFWVSASPLCAQALHQAPQPLILQEDPILVMFPLMGATGKALPGRVLGFLVLEYSPTRQLLPGELELISSVSNQMSYALIQDHTLRQVKAIVDERTAQLQVSLEVQGRLYEKIRHQVDQLRQLNQIKDEFISAISHELRTPLTSMTLAIRMLQEEQLTPQRQAKYLDVLAQQCQQEIALINDLLGLQQLEENSPLISLEKTNIQPILQQLGLTFQQHWTTKALKLKLEVITENPAAGDINSIGNINSKSYITYSVNLDANANTNHKSDLDFNSNMSIEGKINRKVCINERGDIPKEPDMHNSENTLNLANTPKINDTLSLSDTNFSDGINKRGSINSTDTMYSLENIDIQDASTEGNSLSLLPEMYISTHGDTLQRVLAELLTNAGKYSHPATMVILRVEQMVGEIIFSVTNEGEGIPPEEQELIFEKFHRAQTAIQQAIPGTGLGLALVKPLVKHLQGKVTVVSSPKAESAPESGTDKPQGWTTCFTVKLPQFLDDGTV